MPAYEYECRRCGGRFDRRQKMSDPELGVCPDCGGQVKRLISGGAGAITRGAASYSSSAPACALDECRAPETGCGSGCCCTH